MKDTIIAMIELAEKNEDYELMDYIRNIIEELTSTINCPSNWRDIGTELAEKYSKKYGSEQWIYETLQLWDYAE